MHEALVMLLEVYIISLSLKQDTLFEPPSLGEKGCCDFTTVSMSVCQ